MLKIEVNKNCVDKDYWVNIINDEYIGRGVYLDFKTTKDINALLYTLQITGHEMEVYSYVKGVKNDNNEN